MAATSRSTVGGMKRLIAVVAALAFVLAACGDDDQAADDDTVVGEMGGEDITVGELEDMRDAMDDVPTCDDLYAEGNVLTEDKIINGCTDGEGSINIFTSASTDCTDGGKLLWNDWAWWFEGEGVHPHAEGAEQVPPDSAMRECVPG